MLLSALRAWYAADPTDFRHGEGADKGASLWQGSRVGSKREPDSRRPSIFHCRFRPRCRQEHRRTSRASPAHPAVEASDFVAFAKLMTYIVS